MCLTFRASLFVASVAATVTIAAIGIAIVSSKQQTNIAARKKKQADEATLTLSARSTEEIQPTCETDPSNLRTCQTNTSNNRSTDEEQAVSESTCTEQVSLSTRSSTSPQTFAPTKLLVTSSDPSLQTRGTHQEYLLSAASHAAAAQKTQKNVAATNAKTSSS